MNNVFVDQAAKERPRRVREIRDRYKFGMTLITLELSFDMISKRASGNALPKPATMTARNGPPFTRPSPT